MPKEQGLEKQNDWIASYWIRNKDYKQSELVLVINQKWPVYGEKSFSLVVRIRFVCYVPDATQTCVFRRRLSIPAKKNQHVAKKNLDPRFLIPKKKKRNDYDEDYNPH